MSVETIMCSCGHEGIDHDGAGCTFCGCDSPADVVLGPPEAADLPRESWTVDELDALHDYVGLGSMWRSSEARAEALQVQDKAIRLVFCKICDVHAVPHSHVV